MSEYKGVRYSLRWRGLWEWEIFAEATHGTSICKGTLECSAQPEDWRGIVESSIEAEIDQLIARGLVQGPQSGPLAALKNTLQELAADLSGSTQGPSIEASPL